MKIFLSAFVFAAFFLFQPVAQAQGSWKLFPAKKKKEAVQEPQEEAPLEFEEPVEDPGAVEEGVEPEENPFKDRIGKFEVVEEYRISALMELNDSLNKAKGTIPGFRVQIGSETGPNSKARAVNKQNEFLKNYPDAQVYVKWENPNYKVRVGDFRSRLEAQGLHAEIREMFPGAYVVKDNIQLPELKLREPKEEE